MTNVRHGSVSAIGMAVRRHESKAESKRIADETKKLIDARFPKE